MGNRAVTPLKIMKETDKKANDARWEKPSLEWLKKSVAEGISTLQEEGMPPECIRTMLKNARPLGDLSALEESHTYEFYNSVIFPWSRKAGIDESVPNAYGASSIAAKLGISPYVSPEEDYDGYLGIPYPKKEDEEAKGDIFYAGHQMEPVYRNYFRRMFSDRYIVFDCDIQWNSRRFPHFVGDIDGLLYDKKEKKFGILEIKHTTSRNVPTIKEFESGNVPKHYEVQGRGYMELLGASFVCFFLGHDTRPDLTCTACCRIERDQKLGEDILRRCEDFITQHVEKRIPPSFRDIKDRKLREQAIADIFGKVDRSLPVKEFDASYETSLKALLAAKEELEKKKDELKKMQAEVDELENRYEYYQVPFIEKMDQSPNGHILLEDTDYYLSYDARNGIDAAELEDKYPDIYKEVRRPAISTPDLKKKHPDVYKELYKPKPDAKRNFKIRSRRRTTRA